MNVFQKLIKARVEFIKNGIAKNGVNKGLCYSYFELEDIVPLVTKIFDELGMVALVTFNETTADMTIVNVDDPSDCIVISTPVVRAESNKGTTPIQAWGGTMTYYRRYLYMMCMDIVEADSVDMGMFNPTEAEKLVSGNGIKILPPDEPKKETKKPEPPKTKEERQEIKKELTGDCIDDTMIDMAEQILQHIITYHPSDEICLKWQNSYEKSDGFKKVKKAKFGDMMKALEADKATCGTEVIRQLGGV